MLCQGAPNRVLLDNLRTIFRGSNVSNVLQPSIQGNEFRRNNKKILTEATTKSCRSIGVPILIENWRVIWMTQSLIRSRKLQKSTQTKKVPQNVTQRFNEHWICTSVFVDNRDVDDFGTILNKLKQYHLLKGGFSVKFLFCVKYIVQYISY